MARTPKITNQQILDAAREIFLQQGFSASTLEIAQKAGISEASIFKRFSTKEELFFASMGIPEKPPWVQEITSLSGKGNLKENLIQICIQVLEFNRQVVPRLMMLRSRGNAVPEMINRPDSRPVRDLKTFTHFLEREIEQGRLRPSDPQTIAMILLGSLMNYVFLEQIHTSKDIPTDDKVFVQHLVDIVWQGISPSED
ncbi:TetR/AcrR family transcriptional regulator [Sphaerospermopsis aphanizomenoides BCCUSP55]|uniref:TetR/AcrR family transcriptional regulator n=1 Tax=Sphaerospermopsis aphanizomenoides TaxID=459663 RepID=UPI001904DE62|nr:TetR/AcrR family transcriptional regulator [Sphaerospermopsis aphanizomenoides]MBK1987593.1 TetR/AcrR family transcriptional regulator [Sphaerospermopsis aphanizomenoides BCCUSP55]